MHFPLEHSTTGPPQPDIIWVVDCSNSMENGGVLNKLATLSTTIENIVCVYIMGLISYKSIYQCTIGYDGLVSY